MEVWYAIPTADPAKAAPCVNAWQGMGYRVALLVDHGAGECDADLIVQTSEWRGYPTEVNDLLRRVPGDVVVTGGDDVFPDPHKRAQEIAAEFLAHFNGSLGVMQPTGDDWNNAVLQTICGSPWLGREFIDRSYRGNGPFWSWYLHYFCDTELCAVARKLGLLWQRPDLCQRHDHWTRRKAKRPEHLIRAGKRWAEDKAMFEQRQETGFPGHELK